MNHIKTKTTRQDFEFYDLLLGAFVIFSIGVLLVGFQYYLRETTTQFVDTFRTQNLPEMESGDIFTLSSRLNAMTASLNWVCISAEQSQKVFYEQRRGSCQNSFFQRQLTVVSPHNNDVQVHFTLRLPVAEEISFAVLFCFQLFSLGLIYLGSKKAESLRHVEEARLAELATQVAHDVRSPLAALESVLKDISQLPEEQRIIIRSAVSRIRDIANNLIEKNRSSSINNKQSIIDANATEPSTTLLLSSLIDSLITEKRLQYRSNIGIEIDYRIDESSYGLFAKIQPSEFKRVISNLINNAVEALCDNKGTVLVTLSVKSNYVFVQIEDNGKGIPAELLAKLGQKGGTYGKAGGSGLGLHHAKTAAQSWGGRLELSSAINQGTTATIILPQSPAPEWFVSELALIPGQVVVILDDDTSIHHIWQGRLDSWRSAGMVQTVHFSLPQEFRKWVDEDTIRAQNALYLLDYELLGYSESGLKLSEELGLGKQTILVTSRYEEPTILEGCRKLQARMIPKGLAGLVPIRIGKTVANQFDAVLIDDDSLVHATWRISASKLGKKLQTFSTIKAFITQADTIDRQTPVYVDVELDEGHRGDMESVQIYRLGFNKIYLATGHEPEAFSELKHISGVVGKEPPWV